MLRCEETRWLRQVRCVRCFHGPCHGAAASERTNAGLQSCFLYLNLATMPRNPIQHKLDIVRISLNQQGQVLGVFVCNDDLGELKSAHARVRQRSKNRNPGQEQGLVWSSPDTYNPASLALFRICISPRPCKQPDPKCSLGSACASRSRAEGAIKCAEDKTEKLGAMVDTFMWNDSTDMLLGCRRVKFSEHCPF